MFSCAGGPSGPPLRREFVSKKAIIKAASRDKPAKPNLTPDRILRNTRRPRHARDASTAQAVKRLQRDRHHNKIQPLCFPVRADTAVRPYAEDLFQKGPSWRPKQTQSSRFITPGGIGTHGIHPPSKRTPVTARQTSPQNPPVMFSCAGGHSGPPLRGGFVSIGAHSNIDRRRFPTPGGIDTSIAHGDGYPFTLTISCQPRAGVKACPHRTTRVIGRLFPLVFSAGRSTGQKHLTVNVLPRNIAGLLPTRSPFSL